MREAGNRFYKSEPHFLPSFVFDSSGRLTVQVYTARVPVITMSTLEKKIEEYFKLADSDNSGFLSTFELSKVFEKAGHPQTPEQIVQLFSEVDTNRDGQWTLQELKIALSKRSSTEVTEADLRAMFSDIDKDKSGLISVDELKQLLVKCNKAGDAAKYIKCVDTNEDGKINFEEFLKMWKEGQN